MGLVGSAPEGDIRNAQPLSQISASAAPPPRRLFVSGHSLTARPFPDFLAAIATESGTPLDWDMQHLHGSSLRERTQGAPHERDGGYRRGIDRKGASADVLRALATGDGEPFDTLILAEQHTLLESLIWNDTIGHALDFAERFNAANPSGRIYIFASWLNLSDPGDPSRWLAYERAAAPAWHCTAAQIDFNVAARGSGARAVLIPAAEALAHLVEQALDGGVIGISGDTPRQTTSALFADDVHLTEAGTYFIALVTHGTLHGSLPPRAWAPPAVASATAGALQRVAEAFLAEPRQQGSGFDQSGCRRYFAREFTPHYLAYVRDTRWVPDGWIAAQLKWARFRLAWPALLGSDSADNPIRMRDRA